VDLPGHGRSGWSPGHYPIDRTADVVLDVVDRLGLDAPVIFGHSHGGHVGLAVAARAAGRVGGLVLGDVPLDVGRFRAHVQAQAPMTRAWRDLAGSGQPEADLVAALARLPAPDGGTLGDLFDPGHPYLIEMARSLAGHDPAFLDALLDRFDETFAALDVPSLLSRLRCPVLLLQADPRAGGLMSDDDVALVRRHVGPVTVTRLDGVSHGLQLQDPRAVADALTDWLVAAGVT